MARKHDKHRDLAYNLYVMHGYSQKDIATYVGVSEQTISAWQKKGQWDAAKAAHSITTDTLIIDLLVECSRIRDYARNENRILTNKETDMLVKLSSSIKNLKRGNDPATAIGVMKSFTSWLMQSDLELAKTIVDKQKDFVRSLIEQ